MNRRLRFGMWALASSLLLTAGPARAWNSSGHMIVSLVAYDQFDDATKANVVALVKAHPRFGEHFERAMQREVARGSDAEKDQWLFAYASTWPDVVRDSKGGVTREDVQQYSRPLWHYVDEPIFLNDAERQTLYSTVTVNRRRDVPADHDDPDMNVIQAIKNSSRIVADKNAVPELRSVHLCWLLHLVGDSHQPLHSSALFTSRRFPEGDHGGNYLEIEHGFKLHSFWDEQISTDEPFATVRNLASDIAHNAELSAAGKQAASSIDPGVWIDEGHELAKKYVYTPEVLKKVAAREGHSHLGDLQLSANYYVDAETVAERQAVVAGYRLAALLKELLN